jgi:hypothetical protein
MGDISTCIHTYIRAYIHTWYRYKYKVAMGDYVRRPSLSFSEFFDAKMLREVFRLDMFSSQVCLSVYLSICLSVYVFSHSVFCLPSVFACICGQVFNSDSSIHLSIFVVCLSISVSYMSLETVRVCLHLSSVRRYLSIFTYLLFVCLYLSLSVS